MNVKPNYALFDGQHEPIAIDSVAFFAWWSYMFDTWGRERDMQEPRAICAVCKNTMWTAPGCSYSCPCGEITLTRRAEREGDTPERRA